MAFFHAGYELGDLKCRFGIRRTSDRKSLLYSMIQFERAAVAESNCSSRVGQYAARIVRRPRRAARRLLEPRSLCSSGTFPRRIPLASRATSRRYCIPILVSPIYGTLYGTNWPCAILERRSTRTSAYSVVTSDRSTHSRRIPYSSSSASRVFGHGEGWLAARSPWTTLLPTLATSSASVTPGSGPRAIRAILRGRCDPGTTHGMVARDHSKPIAERPHPVRANPSSDPPGRSFVALPTALIRHQGIPRSI